MRSTVSGVVAVGALVTAGILAWQGFHQPASGLHDALLAVSVIALLAAATMQRGRGWSAAEVRCSGAVRIQVESAMFEGQEVPLDGYEYVNCHFSNVTFIYNGTGSFALVAPRFCGRIAFSSYSKQILPLLNLMKQVEEKHLPVEMLAPER